MSESRKPHEYHTNIKLYAFSPEEIESIAKVTDAARAMTAEIKDSDPAKCAELETHIEVMRILLARVKLTTSTKVTFSL